MRKAGKQVITKKILSTTFYGRHRKNYDLIKSELLSSSIAASVTKTSAPLTESWSDGWGQEWEGKDPNDKTDFYRYDEDQDLGKTAGLTFIQGRDFDPRQYPTDSNAMIINESALKVFKFKDPLGKIVKDNGQDWHIVGVIKDFILTNPYQPTKPMLIYGLNSGWFQTMLIKLNHNNATADNLKGQKIYSRNTILNIPLNTNSLMRNMSRNFKAKRVLRYLLHCSPALLFYFLPWLIWFGHLYGGKPDQRDWC